jgi:transcription antitermination factor NusG
MASNAKISTEPEQAPCGSRDARWYCWKSHPGAALSAWRELSRQDFIAYVPMFAVTRANGGETVIPLFGPFGFVQFDITADRWRAIHSTRGIAHLFSADATHPIPVPRGIVEALQARGRPGDGVIDERYVGPEFPGISAGERVRITDGPFADLHGICRWSNQKRIGLLLEVMGKMVETEMRRGGVVKDG